MVFKFGYRHEAWFGIGRAIFDQSESFAFLVIVIGAGIACLITPLLLVFGQLQSSNAAKSLGENIS